MNKSSAHPVPDIQIAQPHAAAQAGLKEWHRIVAEQDWDRLPDLLVDDIAYRSPAAVAPYRGKATLVAIFRTVFAVMQDFTYHRHYGRDNGYVLEFTARVGDEALCGVDLIEFDELSKIADFMVMMRPPSAVMALTEEAGRRIAAARAAAG